MTSFERKEDLMEKGGLCAQVPECQTWVPTSPGSPPLHVQAPKNDSEGVRENAKRDTSPIQSFGYRLLVTFKNLRHLILSRRQRAVESRKTIVRTLAQCPEGYPRLAAFLDSDENFMLYRRFGFLQARLLLNKQDELRDLEKKLDRMDSVDEKTDPSLLRSREKYVLSNDRRKKLFHDIEEKFKEYVSLLNAGRDLANFNRPPTRDYMSVKSYFDEEDPLCNLESYIYCKEDLITLKPGQENAWLDAFVEKVLQKLSCRFVRYLFSGPELSRKTDPRDTGVMLYSRRRIDFVVSLIITIMILVLLIVPVYILWSLTRVEPSGKVIAVIIGVLLIFTMVFSGALSLFTRAKRHEILASAAAYCAVLVVFIGNVDQFSGPKTDN